MSGSPVLPVSVEPDNSLVLILRFASLCFWAKCDTIIDQQRAPVFINGLETQDLGLSVPIPFTLHFTLTSLENISGSKKKNEFKRT